MLEVEKRLNNKIFSFYAGHSGRKVIDEAGKMLFGDDFNSDILYRDQAKEIMLNEFAIFDYRPNGTGSTLFEKFHVEQYHTLDENETKVKMQLL